MAKGMITKLTLVYLLLIVLLVFSLFAFGFIEKKRDLVLLQSSGITPQNLIEIEVADTVGTQGDRWARFGASLPEGNGIVDEDNIRVLEYNLNTQEYGEVYSDIWEQTSRPLTGEFWWVGVSFKANSVSPNERRKYYVDYGNTIQRSAPVQAFTVNDFGTFYRVNTGNGHIFEINKQAFDIFRRVEVGGSEIISESSGSGLEVKSDAGVVYSTSNDQPIITIEEQGDVHVSFRIEGGFKDSLGNKFLDYVARLIIYNDGKVELPLVIQNKGDFDRNIDGAHARFKGLDARLELNLGSQKDLILTEYYGQLFTNERYRAYQDFYPSAQDNDALIYGQDPTAQNIVDNFYLRVIDDTGSTVYFQERETENQQGTRSNGLVAISDASKRVYVAVDDFWQDSPKKLEVQGNTLKVGLFGEEHETQDYFVHDQGPILYTYPNDPLKYSHNAFPNSGALSNHAQADEGNYILHSSVQEYERIVFDFGTGGINLAEAVDFAKAAQEQVIGLAKPEHYRTSNAFANEYRYFESTDWSQTTLSQPVRDAANLMDYWSRALWDETYITQPTSYAYNLVTLVNRLKIGTDASGSFGRPHYGWPYSGQLYWQGEGWQNNGFGSITGIITSVLRTREHLGLSLLDRLVIHNSVDAMYIWGDIGDSIVGSTRHEKGNPVYGYYQSTLANSPRHQWEDGIAMAKLVKADEHIKESLLYSAADFAGGYPFVPTGTAGREPGLLKLTNSVDQLGPLGPQLKNLVGYYQMTGDPEYVNTAKQYLLTFKSVYEACESLYGVKIFVSPALNQDMRPNGLNQWNQPYDCSPGISQGNKAQLFTATYSITGIIEVLEADKQINGFYDPVLQPFFVAVLEDHMQYLVLPYVNTQEPAIGELYNPNMVYGNFHIRPSGSGPPPSGNCEIPVALNFQWELHLCDFGDTTSSAMIGGEVLPWLFLQTNNQLYLDVATSLARDMLLYRVSGNLWNQVPYGDSSFYSTVSWRHFSGLADVKIMMPFLWKMLPYFNIAIESSGGLTCGNGVFDPGEQCGDPGTSGCSLGQSCQSCQCVVAQTVPAPPSGISAGLS